MNIYYIIGAVAIILILLFVYWYSHRSNKEPHEYILVVSFDDGYYYDLCEDERFKKLAQFEKNNNEFIAKTKLNEVYLKKEIGKILEITPLLPWRPAILSPSEIFLFWTI